MNCRVIKTAGSVDKCRPADIGADLCLNYNEAPLKEQAQHGVRGCECGA